MRSKSELLKYSNIKEKVKQLWLLDPKFNRSQASRDFNISRTGINKWVKSFRKEYKNILNKEEEKLKDITKTVMTEKELEDDLENIDIAFENDEKSGAINSKGYSIEGKQDRQKIIDLTIQKAGIDLNEWQVKKARVGFHQTGMKPRIIAYKYGNDDKPAYEHKVVRITQWNCKIELEPIRQPFLRNAIRELVDKVIPLDPINLPTFPLNTKKYAALMEPVDIHFGKLAWGMETLAGNMDLEVAKNVFIDSLMENLSEISLYPVSKIFLVIGHDLMHFENYIGVTPKGGNVLDVDGRLPKVIQKTKESLIYIIDQCMQIAPVHIMRIPGNHDLHASYWMAEILKERYRKNKHVTVDNGPSEKKLITWGDLIIGLTHDASGSKQAPIVNMLPQFWPKEWGKSRWREWHTGHKHKKESTKFKPIYTLGSVIIRQIAALTTIDAWHYEGLFTDAVPSCESFILHKDSGVRSNITHNIDYLKFK